MTPQKGHCQRHSAGCVLGYENHQWSKRMLQKVCAECISCSGPSVQQATHSSAVVHTTTYTYLGCLCAAAEFTPASCLVMSRSQQQTATRPRNVYLVKTERTKQGRGLHTRVSDTRFTAKVSLKGRRQGADHESSKPLQKATNIHLIGELLQAQGLV